MANCLNCGRDFVAGKRVAHRIYCSNRCASKFHAKGRERILEERRSYRNEAEKKGGKKRLLIGYQPHEMVINLCIREA